MCYYNYTKKQNPNSGENTILSCTRNADAVFVSLLLQTPRILLHTLHMRFVIKGVSCTPLSLKVRQK